jgi:hypothetical protein
MIAQCLLLSCSSTSIELDRKKIYRQKMIKGTCLAALQRKIGTPRKLCLGSPRRMALAQRYLMGNKDNQLIKCNKHVLDECIK